AIRLCRDNDIAVHWLTASGAHIASLTASVGQVQRRIRQYRALTDSATCLRLARQLVQAKIEGQHRYLLRATRGRAVSRIAIVPRLRAISASLGSINRAANIDALRGYEG